MTKVDRFNRPYARLCDLKAGDKIELDGGFSCQRATIVTVHKDSDGLFFRCQEGRHYLRGQLLDDCVDLDGFLIGVYHHVP